VHACSGLRLWRPGGYTEESESLEWLAGDPFWEMSRMFGRRPFHEGRPMMDPFFNSLRIAIEIIFVLVFIPTGLAVIYLVKAWPEIKKVLYE
jgi:hypothetical protein